MKIYPLIFALLITLPIAYTHESCNNTETNLTEETLPEGMCNMELDLSTDKPDYKNGEKIEIYNNLTSREYQFTIEYWVENSTGGIIKKKVETTNIKTKQFTPDLKESQNITIKNNLTFTDCININNKTYNELNVFIEVEKDPNPSFSLDKIYLSRSRKISLGENLTAEVTAYTGNLSNLTIFYLVENITNMSELTFHSQFNTTTTNITLQIPNDCSVTEQKYNFTIFALNERIIRDITIEKDCPIQAAAENQSMEEFSNTTGESIINNAVSPPTGRVVYESTNEKARDLATYAAIAVLIVVVATLMLTSKNTDKTIQKSTEKWSSQLEQQ